MPRPIRRHVGVPQAPLKFDFGELNVPGQITLEQFAQERRPRLLGIGGARGGKSWYGARRVLKWAFARGGLGWIVVPDYSYGTEVVRLINAVLYQHPEIVADHHEHPFPKWRLKTVGSFGPAEIEIRSAYDPEQIRASTLSWGWMDEGAFSTFAAYRNLEQRVLSTKGPILVTTTPCGKNWVYDQMYLPFSRGHEDYGVARLRTIDNPNIPAEETEKLFERYGKESAWARQELEGEFVAFEGLVYTSFDTDRHIVHDPGRIPSKWRGVWAGLDWGYAPDPAACVVIGEDQQGVWWVLHEIYGLRLTVPEFARLVDAAVRQFGAQTVYADPSRPDSISQMQQAGIPVVAARKLKESNVAIQKVARLLGADRLKIMHHCKNTIREFGLYRYPDKGKRDKPLGQDDHTMDCLRYCLWMREPEEMLPTEQKPEDWWRTPSDPNGPGYRVRRSGYFEGTV